MELKEVVNISKISHKNLQDEILGPLIVSVYKKLETEKRQTDGFYMLLLGYARSPFRDLESCLRIVLGLVEDDIQLVLKQYISNFATYKIKPGFFSVEGISEVVFTMGGHEGTLKSEYDDISVKTKPNLKRFGGTFGTLRFDEIFFFRVLHRVGFIRQPLLFILIVRVYILLKKFQI